MSSDIRLHDMGDQSIEFLEAKLKNFITSELESKKVSIQVSILLAVVTILTGVCLGISITALIDSNKTSSRMDSLDSQDVLKRLSVLEATAFPSGFIPFSKIDPSTILIDASKLYGSIPQSTITTIDAGKIIGVMSLNNIPDITTKINSVLPASVLPDVSSRVLSPLPISVIPDITTKILSTIPITVLPDVTTKILSNIPLSALPDVTQKIESVIPLIKLPDVSSLVSSIDSNKLFNQIPNSLMTSVVNDLSTMSAKFTDLSSSFSAVNSYCGQNTITQVHTMNPGQLKILCTVKFDRIVSNILINGLINRNNGGSVVLYSNITVASSQYVNPQCYTSEVNNPQTCFRLIQINTYVKEISIMLQNNGISTSVIEANGIIFNEIFK